MDRIELDEELGIDTNKRLQPLDLARFAPESRFKVKPASNINHERNRLLAAEISQLWAIPIPRLMKYITQKGYFFVQETFHQIQKNPNARNPAALFLWTIKNCKVELKDVELK
ncbi:MAG: hypothetical protein ACLGJB_17745 [Blastocatellia bacterium]